MNLTMKVATVAICTIAVLATLAVVLMPLFFDFDA